LASLDWLVANEIEIGTIAAAAGHGREDPRAAGAALAAATGIAVVVTLGKEGAVAFSGGQGWAIGALPITPVDSTGAGDAFVGVLAAALDAGAALPQHSAAPASPARSPASSPARSRAFPSAPPSTSG
jgi:Fructose-1-phosphate kinase and related fructose-6-phosphate kinase (PfkB)